MRHFRLASASAVAITLGGLAVPATGAVTPTATVPGTQLWKQHYACVSGSLDTSEVGGAIAVAPGGYRVFVGGGCGTDQFWEFVTVAYSAATGARLWAQRLARPGAERGAANAVGVSPNGSRVYVTGGSGSPGSATFTTSFATVAYNAATGARLWVKRYGRNASADSLTVSPDGRRVFVTGSAQGTRSGRDYATIAYNAATGAQLWVQRYADPPGNTGYPVPAAIAVNPTGGRVFVTGTSRTASSRNDYRTIAYNATTGARLWVKSYNGPGNGNDEPLALAVSPRGDRVVVTGGSVGSAGWKDYATVAYNTATGTQQWVRRFNGPGNRKDEARSVAVTARNVFVTGQTDVGQHTTQYSGDKDYATIAYIPATGAQRWVKRHSGNGNGTSTDGASAVSANPTIGTVYVTGWDGAGTTIAYNSTTGAQRWITHDPDALPLGIAVNPFTRRVFVTGNMLTMGYAG